jgi:hypothetical protein
MRKPHSILAAFLAVLALVLAAIFLAMRPGAGPKTAELPSEGQQGSRSSSTASLSEPSPGEPAAPDVQEPRVEVDAKEPAPVEVAWDKAASQWVEGQVELPGDLPDDELLEVFAVAEQASVAQLIREVDEGKSTLRRPFLTRERVESDGSFRIAFPPDLKRGYVMCFGRYLFSDRAVAVELGEPGQGARTAIHPMQGTWIRGHVIPPSDPAGGGDLDELEVRLEPDLSSGLRDFDASSFMRREVELDSAGRFEFLAVSGLGKYALVGKPERFAAFHMPLSKLKPKQVLELEIVLKTGGAVRGLVKNEQGQPIAGAEIEARQNVNLMFGNAGRELREVTSGEDGSFSLKAVAAGPTMLRADHEQYLDKSTTVQVSEGAEAGPVEIVLTSGNTVAGILRWPDGRPAADIEVEINFDMSRIGGMEGLNALHGSEGSDETDDLGNFSVHGLGEGPFTVKASAPPPGQAKTEEASGEGEAEPDGEEPEESRKDKGNWVARQDGVAPNTTDLALVLAEPLGMRGRVVGNGNPVTSFRVRAMEKTKGMIPGLGAEVADEKFEDEEGRFFLTGLRENTWNVYVAAEGYALNEPIEVEVPQPQGAEVLIELEPSASASGLVVGPEGEPVPGAKVSLEMDMANMMSRLYTMDQRPEARSDDAGKFTLERLSPGSNSLVASSDSFANSASVSVEVGSGEHVEGIVLTLRIGGRITGEVYDEKGNLAEGQQIMAQLPGRMLIPRMATTDSNGFFEFDRLTPGTYQVMSMGDAGGGGDDPEDMEDISQSFSEWKFASAEVADGEEVHVVLGAPPEDPVAVSGSITLAGDPVPDVVVNFLPEGAADAMSSLRMKSTDAKGQYSVQLDKPGGYLVSVQQIGAMGAQNSLEFNCEVPEAEEFEYDIDLPVGRISGKVIGPDGEPAKGARVSLSSEGPVPSGSMLGGRYTEIATDDQGRYAIEWVRPGSYTVAVGGSLFGGMFGGESAVGRQVRQGVEVREGQSLDGVDFRLREGVSINGVVRYASGQPVSGASVFVRDGSGRLLERFSLLTTDGNGHFTYKGAEPGTYTVSARMEGLASQESAPCTAKEDQPGHAEVVLEEGSMLKVSLEDREGNPIRAAVSVVDANGRQVNGMLSMQDLLEAFQHGTYTSTEHRVGPLPEGSYRVVAVADDGKHAEKPVTLSGSGERALKLRLRD